MVKDSDIVMQAAKKGAGKGKVDGASNVSAAVRTQLLASALTAGNIMPVLSKVVLEYPLQMHAGLITLLLSGQIGDMHLRAQQLCWLAFREDWESHYGMHQILCLRDLQWIGHCRRHSGFYHKTMMLVLEGVRQWFPGCREQNSGPQSCACVASRRPHKGSLPDDYRYDI